MKFTTSDLLPEVIIIEPEVYRDDRRFFFESYQREKYLQHDISMAFVQDNISFSKRGVLRGLHYQLGNPQGKLVLAVSGEIFDVAVDIRKGSPTFGKWTSVTLSSDNHLQVYIPKGFAHGYCILSKTAYIIYKCTDYYAPFEKRGILWNDKSLNISWPVDEPVISERDRNLPGLTNIDEHDFPVF